MQYFDKNGKEIKAGMKILMDDGSIEMVYDTDDQYGNPSLGINASNEEFLKLHPNWAREYYIKIDVYDQVKMNWDLFVDYVWNERKNIKYEDKLD